MKGLLLRLTVLLRLAVLSVVRRPLASALTALSVALGVALVVLVATVRASTERSFADAARGYDVILAPIHGSALQAVLATLFHVDQPGGTLAWAAYERARADERVAAAIPYAMGDTFRGHRVIGTTADLFHVLTDARGRALGDGVRGRLFGAEASEAVIGSVVARATGIGLGQDLSVTHGLEGGGTPHAERWSVVGVLRPTGTPHDRAVYIPIATFHAIPGHADPAPEPHGHAAHEDESGEASASDAPSPRSLSAVGVRLKSPALRLAYLQEYRTTRTDAQAVLPSDEVRRLLSIVGDVDRVVRLVAWLVTAVAAVGILVGLYNTIHGRRREIAVLRALGARRWHVFATILLEALLLGGLGGMVGLLAGHGVAAAAAPALLERWGIRVDPAFGAADLGLLAAVSLLALAAGVLPAWRGLATPVAQNLHPDT